MAKAKVEKIRESVGLDIGTHSIKLVHMKRLHDGWKLLNFQIRPTVPQGMDYVVSDLRPDRFGPVLAEMLKTLHIRPRNVKRLVSSIGGDNTAIKQIKTIFLPDDELESALFFEAKKHLPISGSDMILDFQVLNVEEKTNNMNILLAATTRQVLKEHLDTITGVNLTPGVVDVESLGLANCFALNSMVEDGTYVILNLGAHKTNMVIWGPEARFFSRDIPWGGYHFSKDIMRKRSISFEQAEAYKLENGIKQQSVPQATTIAQALDITEKTTEEQIAMEVKRSLRFYVKEAGNSDFRKILLVGGTAKLHGLAEYFQENINIPTEVYNPFVNVDMPEKFRDKKDPQLALALGLAMRPE
jgi:type IV pilus assembly protein PilM